MTERLKSLEPCECWGCSNCQGEGFLLVCGRIAEYTESDRNWCPSCLEEQQQRELEEQLDSFIDNQARKEH